MKTIVVYKSKTGYAKKYAQWIATELQADIYEAGSVDIKTLKEYATIIYGGGLYAVGINGIKLIIKNTDELKDKNIIIFATGASPSRKEDVDKVWHENIPSDVRENIHFFYFRGGFNYENLTPFDKILMSMLKWKLQHKKEATVDERGMLASYETPVDFTKCDRIKPLTEYVKGL